MITISRGRRALQRALGPAAPWLAEADNAWWTPASRRAKPQR